MQVRLEIETKPSTTTRARQVECLFDVSAQEVSKLSWNGDVPIEKKDWNIGLVVGPSGSGKTTVAREMFGDSFQPRLEWSDKAVIDDVDASIGVDKIASAFSSVGFSTIPAWLRSYHVLSNGEKFRVDLARRLLELKDPIVVDEFTSVVDRQVAKVAAHAVQKWVRRSQRQLVAVTCHHDVIEWLQPDWILEPSTMSFTRRLLRRRPSISITISKVKRSTWGLFAPFHYMTKELNVSASCYAVFVDEHPVAFLATLHFPHPKVKNLKRVTRLVTLPDWQGVGLAFVLCDGIGSGHRFNKQRFRMYPAHPSLIRSFNRSENWRLCRRPGNFVGRPGKTSARKDMVKPLRPCAVFEYVGPANHEFAKLL